MNKYILILTSPFRPNIGGVETHLDDLIKAGLKWGFSFKVIAYQPLVTKARGKFIEKGKNYEIYRVPWPRFNLFLIFEKYPLLEFIYLFPGLFFAGFVYLLFNRNIVKVIHSQGLAAGSAGMILGKIFGLDNIISTHSIYHFPEKSHYSGFVKYIFINSKKVLTLSRQSKREVVGIGVPEEKVDIFTYWVDQEIFTPLDKKNSREILDLSDDNFIVLFVGRLVEVKGVSELLETAKLLDPKIKIVIVGDGPMADSIKSQELGIKNLIFKGKVNNVDLPLYYNAADVLVVPSVHEEGFGRVILEALSCGLPVIGSNRGAIPEAIDNSVGILIDVTPDNLKKAIEKIHRDSKLLRELKRNARRFALKRYGAKNAQEIIKYY